MVERAAPQRRQREEEEPEVPLKERTPPEVDLREFQDNLRFDRDALDDALMGQPDLFYRVSDAYAMAISYRDGLKLDLEQASAELDKQFRKKHDAAEEKYTEKSILGQVETSPRIMTLKDRLGDANLKVAKLGALKEAYQQRSYAIKDMCGLYVSNYFSNQAGSGAREDARGRQADDIRERAGEKRRTRE